MSRTAEDWLARARTLLASAKWAEAMDAARECLRLSVGNAEALAVIDAAEGGASSTPRMIGRHVEIRRLLGKGGMGRVFEVYHRGWGITLAAKSPLADVHVESFVREAETWIGLPIHPNVTACHYIDQLDGRPIVLAEFVPGGSILDAIADGRVYDGGDAARVIEVGRDAIAGIALAHDEELVHQDIKPHNLLLGADGRTKVTDFGLARAVSVATSGDGDAPAGATVRGMTPAYCSPEQAAGSRVTAASDVWSWAVTMLHLCSGEHALRSGATAPQALAAAVERGSWRARPPDALVELLRDCFARTPADRPVAAEVSRRLDAIARRPRRPAPAVPRNATALATNRAVSRFHLGDTALARRILAEALATDPDHVAARYDHELFAWHAGLEPVAAVRAAWEALPAAQRDELPAVELASADVPVPAARYEHVGVFATRLVAGTATRTAIYDAASGARLDDGSLPRSSFAGLRGDRLVLVTDDHVELRDRRGDTWPTRASVPVPRGRRRCALTADALVLVGARDAVALESRIAPRRRRGQSRRRSRPSWGTTGSSGSRGSTPASPSRAGVPAPRIRRGTATSGARPSIGPSRITRSP